MGVQGDKRGTCVTVPLVPLRKEARAHTGNAPAVVYSATGEAFMLFFCLLLFFANEAGTRFSFACFSFFKRKAGQRLGSITTRRLGSSPSEWVVT